VQSWIITRVCRAQMKALPIKIVGPEHVIKLLIFVAIRDNIFVQRIDFFFTITGCDDLVINI
jgi:hypothetical protein